MCPACAIGLVFLAQLLGMVRWFQRVVLKKAIPEEDTYWKPNESMLSPRMREFAKSRRKMTITCIVIGAEIAAAIIIYKLDGFMFIKQFFMILK